MEVPGMCICAYLPINALKLPLGRIGDDARQGWNSQENPRSPGCPIAQQATIPPSTTRVFIEWRLDAGMLGCWDAAVPTTLGSKMDAAICHAIHVKGNHRPILVPEIPTT